MHIKRFGAGATEALIAALTLLQRDGYNGPLTIEHWGDEEETLEGIEVVRALLEAVE